MCLSPVRPAVRRVGSATCITLSPLIKSSLPGNLVAWQHERGSPRGDFSRVRGEGKQKGRRKGRSLAPTGASHFLPLCLDTDTGGVRPRCEFTPLDVDGFWFFTWEAACSHTQGTLTERPGRPRARSSDASCDCAQSRSSGCIRAPPSVSLHVHVYWGLGDRM